MAGLSPFAPELAARRAGRLMLEEIDRCAAAGISFAFETTLAGKAYGQRIRFWQVSVYSVKTIDNAGESPRLLSEGGQP